jgi:hypothetical protein
VVLLSFAFLSFALGGGVGPVAGLPPFPAPRRRRRPGFPGRGAGGSPPEKVTAPRGSTGALLP